MFDAFVMVDWSAASRRGREGGEPGGIWAAVGGPAVPDDVRPFRTRLDARRWVGDRLQQHSRDGLRTLCGFDFAFGYPAGMARALGSDGRDRPWASTADLLDRLVADRPDGTNDRLVAAATLNRRLGASAGPFWGVPAGQATDSLRPTKPPFPVTFADGTPVPEHRHVERWWRARRRQPKSVWQLAGAGSVGGQSLVGIPVVHHLREQLGDRGLVWPFETGFQTPEPRPGDVVLVEVYPSLLGPDATLHDVPDAAQVIALVNAYSQMDADGRLAAAFDPPADLADDVIRDVVAEEGWILPVTRSHSGAPLRR